MSHYNTGHYTTDFGGVVIISIPTPIVEELVIVELENKTLSIIEPKDSILEIKCECIK